MAQRLALASLLLAAVLAPLVAGAADGKDGVVARRVSPADATPPSGRFLRIKAHPVSSSTLYAPGRDGLSVSRDGGITWQPMPVAGTRDEVFAVAADPSSPDRLLVSRRGNVWKTDDGGRTWMELPYPSGGPYVALALAVAPGRPDVIYMTTARDGVFRSDDGGHRWRSIDTGLPRAPGGAVVEIRSLVVHPLNPDVAFVAHESLGVSVTTDGGRQWSEANAGLPFPIPRAAHPPRLIFDPDDPGRLYLLLAQPMHSRLTRNRLHVLRDGADRWIPVTIRLPDNTPMRGLTFEMGRRTLRFWSDDGVWEAPAPRTP